MSIQTELTRIINAKAAIKAAIEGKGVTVPAGTLLDDMAALIESIEAGGGGSSGGNGASGTYIVASTEIIGTAQNKAIYIDTGLPQVNYFAFVLDGINSNGGNGKMLCSVWFRQNDKYYGRRYQQSGSSYTSIYPANNLTGNDTFVDINGTMQICGITSSSKIVAGDRYCWFAL